jgi:hypothetical protein
MAETGWRKSSRSTTPTEQCVEVRFAEVVGVRDSKNVTGPAFEFAPVQWRAFVVSLTARQR